LVLWGAGNMGYSAVVYCEDNDIPIECFVDAYKGGEYRGYKIIAPNELKIKYPNAVILLCTTVEKLNRSMWQMLFDIGMEKNGIDFFQHMWKSTFNVSTFEQLTEHLNDYEWVYNILEDSLSKYVLLDYMRMIALNAPLRRTEYEGSYFETGLFELTDREIFVDGGADIGDSVEIFMNNTPGG